MAPIVKEPEVSTSAQPNLEGNALAAGRAQAAAAEIAVTVNGARTAAGTNKREPFSENTSTVLVFPKGAVIRLASAVAAGQLLFLTNEKTKKEVVCQVVKAKSEGSTSGYVELQFTEPAAGFWGMRFPGSSPATSLPAESKPIISMPIPAAPTQSLDEKLAEIRTKPAIAAPAEEAKSKEQKLELQPAAELRSAAESQPAKSETKIAAEPAAAVPGIPTLSQFLSQGDAGPELKISEKTKADNGDKSTAGLAELRARTEESQQSLSTQLLNPPVKPKLPVRATPPVVIEKPSQGSERTESLSKLLLAPPTPSNPAPGTSTFDFAADEVKIPAWLEPLARNSAASSPAPETKSRESYEPPAKSAEDWAVGDKSSEALLGAPAPAATEEASAEEPALAVETESALLSEGPTPNFGSSLALDRKSHDSAGADKGSNKGLIVGLLAAGLLLAAGGGWYWYSNQPADSTANGANSVKSNYATPSEGSTTSVAPVSEPAKSYVPAKVPATDSNRAGASLPSAGHSEKAVGTPSNPSAKSPANEFDLTPPATKPAPTPEPEKKPSMGKVHLAAPVVNRRTSEASTSSDAAPALSANGTSAIDASNLGALTSKSNQPAAPLPVGGDVKSAHLLSSVPPIYPQLAKNQRVGGDVKMDALIDASGRVTATKIISGPALLQQAAIDAVRQWKYQPATLNGTAMPMHLTVTVQFKVQ